MDKVFKRFFYKDKPTDYFVSEYGDVYSSKTQKILKPAENESGRLRVCLRIDNKDITVSIHRMVADTFIMKIPEGMTVDHKDEKVKNNFKLNLDIVSRKENTIRYLENHNLNEKKYSDKLVHKLCKELQNGVYYKKVAEKFGVPNYFVFTLVQNKARKNIIKNYLPFPIESKQKENRRNKKELKKEISKLITIGFSNKEIFNELKIENNNANNKIIIKCRNKLNIKDPKYFDLDFIEKIMGMVEIGFSNNQIIEILKLDFNKRLSFLLTRIRKKSKKPDFNERGLNLDKQKEIMQLIIDGKDNIFIENKFSLERNSYTINLLGRLRQKVKKEKSSTTIEKIVIKINI